MSLDYAKIKEAAKNYEKDMTKFLRDIVKFPGESCDEKAHIDRIAEEMTKLGFDKVDIDPMGNVLGYMGTGKTLIGFDAHIDTVGIGNKNNWNFDPYGLRERHRDRRTRRVRPVRRYRKRSVRR